MSPQSLPSALHFLPIRAASSESGWEPHRAENYCLHSDSHPSRGRPGAKNSEAWSLAVLGREAWDRWTCSPVCLLKQGLHTARPWEALGLQRELTGLKHSWGAHTIHRSHMPMYMNPPVGSPIDPITHTPSPCLNFKLDGGAHRAFCKTRLAENSVQRPVGLFLPIVASRARSGLQAKRMAQLVE